jgi:hypothetical protein
LFKRYSDDFYILTGDDEEEGQKPTNITRFSFHISQVKYFYLSYTIDEVKYIRKVTLTKDAKMTRENNGFRTESKNLVQGEKRKFWLDDYISRKDIHTIVYDYGLTYFTDENGDTFKVRHRRASIVLSRVKSKDKYMYLSAMQNDGMALQFVDDQDEYLCSLAVRENGLALQFVLEKLRYLSEYAVQENGLALQFVDEQTEKICALAIKQNKLALQFVKNKTPELIELAK